jgi:hypothetical protein
VAICADKNIYLPFIGWIVLDVAVILGAVMTGNTASRSATFPKRRRPRSDKILQWDDKLGMRMRK